MSKLLSGRFIFAVVASLVFAWGSVYNLLSGEQIMSILLVVVAFYFNKKKEE